VQVVFKDDPCKGTKSKSHKHSRQHETSNEHKFQYTCLADKWTAYDQLQQLAERALLAQQLWEKVSDITIHLPWQQELKSALFDFQQREADLRPFKQVAASVEKKERLALVLLSFIKERATHGGQVLLFDIRSPDFVFGSSRPWMQEIFRLISTDGHIIIYRVQLFLETPPTVGRLNRKSESVVERQCLESNHRPRTVQQAGRSSRILFFLSQEWLWRWW